MENNFRKTTRDGNPVRIYATDGTYPYPIHGAIQRKDGWEEASWTKNGQYSISQEYNGGDLIPLKNFSEKEINAAIAEYKEILIHGNVLKTARTIVIRILRAADEVSELNRAHNSDKL